MVIALDVLAMFIFFAIVGILLIVDRKNIEFNYGLIIRRWKHGRQVMDRWIFSHKKFLHVFGTVGVVVGIVASLVGLGLIIYFTTLSQQASALILPTAGGFQYPTTAIIGVPFWFWIVAVFVVLTVHEPMHAIFSRLAGVPVKSWGIMTLLVIPVGAFVDPDMKKVYKLKLMQKLKIFAGGSFGNFIAGAVSVLLLLLFLAAFYIQVPPLTPNSPAADVGLQGKIISINGESIENVDDVSKVLRAIPVGSEIEVATNVDVYKLTTVARPDGAEGSYIGVVFDNRGNQIISTVAGLKPEYQAFGNIISTLVQLFGWLTLFNIGVGVFNMLPLRPFDGGYIFEAIFARFLKDEKKARTLINITSIIVFGIILYNILGTDIKLALPF